MYYKNFLWHYLPRKNGFPDMDSPIIERWDFGSCDVSDIIRMYGKGLVQTVYDFKLSAAYHNRGEVSTKDSDYRERGKQGLLLLKGDKDEWDRIEFLSSAVGRDSPEHLRSLLVSIYDSVNSKVGFNKWVLKE